MKAAVSVAVLLAIVVIVLFAGVPSGIGGLEWDSSATRARIAADQQIEAQRIASNERLEMERLAVRAAADARSGETWQLFFWVVGGVVVLVVAIRYGYLGIVRLIAYWQHRTDRQAEVMLAALPLMAQRPGSRLELVDQEWFVVDDARRELVPVERRLTSHA